jgi:hypothetical protein
MTPPPERSGSREALERVRRLARLLDESIPIPGTSFRIGLDPLLGLIPGLGDVATAVAAAWVVVVAARLGAPPSVLVRLLANVALDAAGGSIPIVGDLFDAGFKANVRNVRVLEAWLERPEATRRGSRLAVVATASAALLVVAGALACAWVAVAWFTRSTAGR